MTADGIFLLELVPSIYERSLSTRVLILS